MIKHVTRSAAVFMATFGLATGIATTTASAATSSTADRPVSGANAASVREPSWCGWHPANTAWNPGEILQAPLNLRDGQSTSCNRLGTFTSTGWGQLNIHCETTNGAGETWYYVDSNLGNGWVFAGDILAVFNVQGC